jgi:ABC-type oligopeptide transport system substrate-binding subunit
MSANLTIALDSAPLSKDPYWPADYDGRLISAALTRPLLAAAKASGAYGGRGSALRAEYLELRDSWRVHLDTSLRWSDGTQLTSADVLRSAQRVLGRPHSMAFRLLHGESPRADAVRSAGAGCVEFSFARPVSFAEEVLTLPQLAPCRTALSSSLGAYQLIGTGDRNATLARNPYQQPQEGEPAELLEFRFFPDVTRAINEYASGAVDVLPTTGMGTAELALARGGHDVPFCDIPIFGCLDFGSKSSLLSGPPEVRHALGASLNRTAIARALPDLIRPYWTASGAWSHNAPTAEPTAKPAPVHVDAVRKALGTNVEIPFAAFRPNDEIVAGICEQLKSVFGIAASGRPLDYRQYARTVVSGGYSLMYTLTVADFCHPAALLLPWHSDSPHARRLGFRSTGLDRRIDAAAASFDDQDSLWLDADEHWLELMPRIPVIQVRAGAVHGDRVRDVRLGRDGLIDMDRLSLTRSAQLRNEGIPS